MDTAQWPQGMGTGARPMVERRTRPQKDQALNCPRCNSTNTKFCYYNNYSLTQPRYFCKTCRRYWTEGGSLRNVPVGGGSRKNKKTTLSSSSSSSLPSPASSKKLSDPNNPPSFPESAASQNPKIHGGQDLNLAYPPPTQEGYNNLSKFVDQNPQNPSSSSTSSHLSAMEFLKTGISSGGLSSFMQMPVSDNSNMMYSSGFPMQEFKPTLNFSLDGFDQSGYGGLQGVQESSGARLFFPIEDLKQQVSSTTGFEQNRGQGDHSAGYWNGMLGGGSW